MKYSGYLTDHVVSIIRWHKKGLNLREIAQKLDERGVKTYGTYDYIPVTGEIERLAAMVRHVLVRKGFVARKGKYYRKEGKTPLHFWQNETVR